MARKEEITQTGGQEFKDAYGLRYFHKWLHEKMPNLNNEILNKRVELSALVEQVQGLVAQMPEASTFNRDGARVALQYLGFAVSSVERHAQDRGIPAGEALKTLSPDMEDTLIILGNTAGHSPRDTVYTFSLWNDPEDPITFTGDDQERLFIDVVAKSFDLAEQTATNIHTVLHSDLPLSDEQNIALIERSTAQTEDMRQQFLRYTHKGPDGKQALTPDFFLNVFRQYNCNFPIKGENWGAPTAANSHSHWLIDLMIQPVEPGYQEHILSRQRYLTTEDQVKVQEALDKPGLLQKLGEEIGINPDVLETMEDEQYAEFIKSLPVEQQKAVASVGKFLEVYANASAMHWNLIHNYMIKPLKMEIATATTVATDRGTSGMTLPEVAHIRDARLQNPFLLRYKAARDKSHK